MSNVVALPQIHDDRPPGTLTSQEVCTAAGISFRQLDYWARLGLLRAANGPQPGHGYPRFFARSELTVAALMRVLLDAGLQPRPAHEHARHLAETGTTMLAGMPLHLPQEL